MKIKLALLFILISVATIVSQNRADTTNKLLPGVEEFTISKHFVYSSKFENKTIKEFIANDALLEYTTDEFVNTGAFSPYIWIKIDLENNTDLSTFIFELNQTYIDSLNVYLVKDATVIKSFPKKGLYFEENNNPSYFSNKYAYKFEINLAKNDITSIYINAIVNDGSFRTINKIWSLNKYEERKKDVRYRTSYLLFFGGFASLVVFISLSMFLFSKRKIYLYYAGFVLVIFLNLICLRYFVNPIYIEKYLFLGNNFGDMLALLQAFLMLKYAIHLFSLKRNNIKIYRLLNALAHFTIIAFLLSLFLRRFEWFYTFIFYFTKVELIFMSVLIYGVAIYLIGKKEIMAYYFVIAYAPLMFVICHYILTAMKLTNLYNPLQWELVIFVEIFVLSIAMAHKYYLLIQENLANEKKLEQQRLKISRDLHDNIGSQLTFIISSIDNLKFLMKSNDEKVKEKLSTINNFAANTIAQLRDTIWAMNKNEISYSDFHGRVLSQIEKAKISNNQIQYKVKNAIQSDFSFSSLTGINLFRTFQEALNNALKHSKATLIEIDIYETKNRFTLRISDNGKGFDMSTTNFGNGLENMQKRLEEIEGELTINSKMSSGTTISISVKKNT